MVKVWDVSKLKTYLERTIMGGKVDADGDGLFDEIDDDDPYGLKPKVGWGDGEDPPVKALFAWRAHTKPIARVEYLKGIEAILTASVDCTARLWTLAGEQVGLFGQETPWTLEVRDTWLDQTRCVLGDDNDAKAATVPDDAIRALLPPNLRAAQPDRRRAEKPGARKEQPEGTMSADELRGVLQQLKQTRPGSALGRSLMLSTTATGGGGGGVEWDAGASNGGGSSGGGAARRNDPPPKALVGNLSQRSVAMLRATLPPLDGSPTSGTLKPSASYAGPLGRTARGGGKKAFSTNRWAPDRSRPLGELLSESGAMPMHRDGRKRVGVSASMPVLR